MARIQTLELPVVDKPDGTTETPFALIIDQIAEPESLRKSIANSDLAPQLGARAILAFEETVEIPANWATVDGPDGNVLHVRVEPDLTDFTDKIAGAVEAAQQKIRAGSSTFNPAHYWLNIGDDSLTVHCRLCQDGIFKNPSDRYHQCFLGGPGLDTIHAAIQKHHDQHHNAA